MQASGRSLLGREVCGYISAAVACHESPLLDRVGILFCLSLIFGFWDLQSMKCGGSSSTLVQTSGSIAPGGSSGNSALHGLGWFMLMFCNASKKKGAAEAADGLGFEMSSDGPGPVFFALEGKREQLMDSLMGLASYANLCSRPNDGTTKTVGVLG